MRKWLKKQKSKTPTPSPSPSLPSPSSSPTEFKKIKKSFASTQKSEQSTTQTLKGSTFLCPGCVQPRELTKSDCLNCGRKSPLNRY